MTFLDFIKYTVVCCLLFQIAYIGCEIKINEFCFLLALRQSPYAEVSKSILVNLCNCAK